MELSLPMNYVELNQEEMMYLDGGLSFGRNWWNSRETIAAGIDVALLLFGIWSVEGQAAKKWIPNNVNNIAGATVKYFSVSISMRKKIVATISGLAGITSLSVGYFVAWGIDAADGWFGSYGNDGYCFG